MKSEWLKCPRCKNKRLKAELLSTEPNGSNNMWWVCENYTNCMFPFDMPAKIYKFTQTVQQIHQNFLPLPRILYLPEKYKYMYPLTFADSRPPSRCQSVVGTKTNSRNETTDSSENTSTTSEKSSGFHRLKAEDVRVESAVASTSAAAHSFETAGDQEIDADLEATGKKRAACRTVRRKRYSDSKRSWASLVEKVASDPVASSKIINMEESELFSRMKDFFDDKYFRGTALSFKRPARRVTYQFDDVETCLRTITQDDWENARKRLPEMMVNGRIALQSASNAHELLKSVGIDVEQRKIAVSEKVVRVMKEFNVPSPECPARKRQKIDEESDRRSVPKQQKNESSQRLRNEIHLSVSARLLNRKLRNDEERSATSTPAPPSTFCVSEVPTVSQPEEVVPGPVHFQLGNDEEEPEHNWGFDLDGLYDSIDAQNQQRDDFLIEGLASLDDAPQQQELYSEMAPVVESDDERASERNDDDEYAGFDDFNSNDNSNYDFVNDNFEF